MTLAKRLDNVEDNLSPREAVVHWMREAHQFESLFDYLRWLLGQPDDVHPLVRMPAQVVAAVRKCQKGLPDSKLRPQLYRAHKDVFFLYHLHQMVNLRHLADREALALRVLLLIRQMRVLLQEDHARSYMRLGGARVEGNKRRKSVKPEQPMTTTCPAHYAKWLKESKDLLTSLGEFQEALRLLSLRYFSGEDLLFPEARESLDWNMRTVGNLRGQFADSFLCGAAALDDKIGAAAGKDDGTGDLPDVSLGPRALAEQLVLMARAATLEVLGEHGAAARTAEKLVGPLERASETVPA
jgi:hypothetical protein